MIILIVIATILAIFGLVIIRGAPYVPTLGKEIEQAFSVLYKLGPQDTLVDIGSGDGIVLRHGARRGATAIGYEINPILVLVSRLASARNPRVQVKLADFWQSKLPQATTVVYIFSVSRDARKLADKIQHEANRLGKPLRLITYGAELRDKPADKKHRGHHLYTFIPLHKSEA